MTHALAGQAAPSGTLIDVAALEREFFERIPDPGDSRQRVAFGTSGHRGTPLDGSFTAAHIAAITQAICEYRRQNGIDGPLYIGKDTHALSTPAEHTALEVLAANGVQTVVQRTTDSRRRRSISRAILAWNQRHGDRLADGIVITPSHNPPEDGGFKYNPPHGGPADTGVTRWIQDRANELLLAKNAGVRRSPGRRMNAPRHPCGGSRPAVRRRPRTTSSTSKPSGTQASRLEWIRWAGHHSRTGRR